MNTERKPTSPSPEADILRRIDELIRKVALGLASTNEMQLLQELQKTRTDMMRPNVFSQKEEAA